LEALEGEHTFSGLKSTISNHKRTSSELCLGKTLISLDLGFRMEKFITSHVARG